MGESSSSWSQMTSSGTFSRTGGTAGLSSTSGGSYSQSAGSFSTSSYASSGSYTSTAADRSTAAGYQTARGGTSLSTSTGSGTYSGSTGPTGSSSTATGAFTSDASSSSYSRDDTAGTFLLLGRLFVNDDFVFVWLPGTFARSSSSDSGSRSHQEGTVSFAGAGATRTGTYSQDSWSRSSADYAEHFDGVDGPSDTRTWSSVNDSRREEGELRPSGSPRASRLLVEEHRRWGSNFDASATSSGEGGTSTSWSRSRWSASHDLSSAATISYTTGANPTASYSYDHYAFSSSSDFDQQNHADSHSEESDSTFDGGHSHHGWVRQNGSGAGGTFEMESQGNGWWYRSVTAYHDGRPTSVDEHSEPYHERYEGTLSLSGGTAVVTSTVGGSLGQGWWGGFWWQVNTSVQYGWATAVSWAQQGQEAALYAWGQAVAFAQRPWDEKVVVLGDLATLGYFSDVVTGRAFGQALDGADQFFAGTSGALTGGLTTRAREAMWGDTATRNHQGIAFNVGVAAGTALGIALGFANPCGAAGLVGAGLRGLNGLQAVGSGLNAYENYQKGNYWSAAFDAIGAVGSISSLLRACFVAGTPLLTPEGSKPIEQVREGDLVLSRDEFDPQGPVVAKMVEEVFVRTAPVLNLHVRGRIIGTTAEHPFYVEGQGWLPCAELRVGDVLVSHDGRRLPVEGVADSGQVTTVYNMRIADFHTYFVGSREWGFDVWAHNAYRVPNRTTEWSVAGAGARASVAAGAVVAFSAAAPDPGASRCPSRTPNPQSRNPPGGATRSGRGSSPGCS